MWRGALSIEGLVQAGTISMVKTGLMGKVKADHPGPLRQLSAGLSEAPKMVSPHPGQGEA